MLTWAVLGCYVETLNRAYYSPIAVLPSRLACRSRIRALHENRRWADPGDPDRKMRIVFWSGHAPANRPAIPLKREKLIE
jgi:hypothetical protein